METIFVLMRTNAGKLESVLQEVKKREGIAEAFAVTGTYDIIAKIQTNDITKALSTIAKQLRTIDGIKEVESLVAVEV